MNPEFLNRSEVELLTNRIKFAAQERQLLNMGVSFIPRAQHGGYPLVLRKQIHELAVFIGAVNAPPEPHFKAMATYGKKALVAS
jgi:hypothetical protein